MPNKCVQETSNGEVNIQLPLQVNRAGSQQFECITSLLTDGDEWLHVQPRRGQSDFKYLLEDKTLSLHVRFEQTGLYQVEIIGKEESSNDPDLNEFEWVVIYLVEVKGLPQRVIMFPTEESIGWGPGRKVTETGLEILSHKEGTSIRTKLTKDVHLQGPNNKFGPCGCTFYGWVWQRSATSTYFMPTMVQRGRDTKY